MSSHIAQRMEGFSPFYVMELLQRAKQLESEGKEIIHMEIGEPDLGTPENIIKAGLNKIKTGDVKYTPASGLLQLRLKIAEYYSTRYKVNIDPKQIFITPGASGAFLLALGVTLNPGEEILMSDPCYPCNSNFVRFLGGHTRFINVNETTNYQLTAELINNHWQPNSRGVVIASPSNPTGTLILGDELSDSIKMISERGGYLFSDEIYHGLVYNQQAATALNYSQNVFVINSFSKYFAMTGWRVGWLIVPKEFIDSVDRLSQNLFISTATHSQYAALAAFDKNCLLELEKRKEEFRQRRNFLYQNLISLGFEIPVKPEGAFYIYARCSRFTDDSFQFAKDLLEQEGVALTSGKDFGNNEANCYIRFAYTSSIAKMSDAIKKIERFICQ